jgi:hypothetical protein
MVADHVLTSQVDFRYATGSAHRTMLTPSVLMQSEPKASAPQASLTVSVL